MKCKKFSPISWPMPKKRLIKLSILILGALMLLAFLTQTALFIAKSESLEGRVFLVLKGFSYGRGDIVGIQDFETQNHLIMPRLLKKVMGLGGDRVRIEGDQIFINDELIGPLFKETSTGRCLIKTLTPIQEQIIPEKCLFLSGTHPRSFDSRYKEFGLLCLGQSGSENGSSTKVLGKAIRII